jgi:hypothetical protein
LCRRYIVAFTKVLTIYHTWIQPLHHSPLFPCSPISGMVSTSIIFQFTYICTQYLHYIHPLTTFNQIFTPPTGTKSLERTCSTFLFYLVKKKKMFV